MNRLLTPGLAMLGGVAIGAMAVNGLLAQGGPPRAYAIVDISEITDPATFQTLLPKTGPANAAFGGQFVARTENIVALDGAPPKRFVIIGFGSIERAKAWDASAAQQEINAIRIKSTKSRTFVVDATIQ